MSLDVYLRVTGKEIQKECHYCYQTYIDESDNEVFWANITHNLNNMAGEIDNLYEALWRPEEIGATVAADIIPHLENGLKELEAKPEHYKQFNASNGWGTYEGLVKFITKYLRACKEYPEATIHVSR